MSNKSHAGSNGSNGHSKTAPDKWEAALESTHKGSLTWADVGSEDLVACLAAVTEDGAALLLSKTSDGGALMLQVLAGNSRPKWYPASMAALNAVLQEITERANEA